MIAGFRYLGLTISDEVHNDSLCTLSFISEKILIVLLPIFKLLIASHS